MGMPPLDYVATNLLVGLLTGMAIHQAGRFLVRTSHLSEFRFQWVIKPLRGVTFSFFMLRALLPFLSVHYILGIALLAGIVGVGVSFTLHHFFVRRSQ